MEDSEDPGADTAMFRAFVDRPVDETRSKLSGALLIGLGVIVAIVIVVLLLV